MEKNTCLNCRHAQVRDDSGKKVWRCWLTKSYGFETEVGACVCDANHKQQEACACWEQK